MSIQTLLDKNLRIKEIWEVVGVYEIYLQDVEQKLKIKVKKLYPASSEVYVGIPNLRVKGKDYLDGYVSSHFYSTAEEALGAAIREFLAFLSDEAEIQEVENW